MRSAAAVAAAVCAMALAPADATAPASPPCATPTPGGQTFAKGTRKTLTWTQPSDASQGGGFVVEAASAPDLDPDGSFVDANLVKVRADLGATVRAYEFRDLLEATHHYHARAKTRSGVCTESPWSVAVATAQDATPPEVSVTTDSGKNFVLEDVTIEGTATDAAAGTPPATSGVSSVVVNVASTTPILGPMLAPPARATVTPGQDGGWAAVFTGMPPGTYRATILAFDGVTNQSEQTVITFTVVNGAP